VQGDVKGEAGLLPTGEPGKQDQMRGAADGKEFSEPLHDGENDGLVRSQVSSLLARIIDASGETLSQTRAFPDVNADVADLYERVPVGTKVIIRQKPEL